MFRVIIYVFRVIKFIRVFRVIRVSDLWRDHATPVGKVERFVGVVRARAFDVVDRRVIISFFELDRRAGGGEALRQACAKLTRQFFLHATHTCIR